MGDMQKNDKKKLTLKWWILMLTGIFFFAYAAYNVFIIIRSRSLSPEGILISAVVALLFLLLTAYVWTCGVKFIPFLAIRRMVLIGVLFAIFLLKLRRIGQVISYVDLSVLPTILYAFAYFFTLTALLILFIDYTFIRRDILAYLKEFKLLPILAIILFMCSLILDGIMLFVYGIGVEASPLRTIVIRPVYYL